MILMVTGSIDTTQKSRMWEMWRQKQEERMKFYFIARKSTNQTNIKLKWFQFSFRVINTKY